MRTQVTLEPLGGILVTWFLLMTANEQRAQQFQGLQGACIDS